VAPAVQLTATEAPLVAGVQLLTVSVQYCVLATPAPPPSLGVRVTVWLLPTHPAAALLAVVGAAASTVRVTALAVPVPPPLVARMFRVSPCPLLPVSPVFVHVKLGPLPDTVAASQVLPFVVYSHPLTALSLSVKLAVSVKGLLT